MRKVQAPHTFQQEEGQGLLSNYYQEEDAVNDALRGRRQKLAEKKLHLSPDSEDTDYGEYKV